MGLFDNLLVSFSSLVENISNNKDYKEFLTKGLFLFIILLVIIILSVLYFPNYNGILLNVFIVIEIIFILTGILFFVIDLFQVIKKKNLPSSFLLILFTSLISLGGFGFSLFLCLTYLIPQMSGIVLVLFLFFITFVYLSILIFIIVKFYEILKNEKFSLIGYYKNIGFGLLSGLAIIILVFAIIYAFSFFSSHLLILKLIIVIITLLLVTKVLSKVPKIDKVYNLLFNTILYIPCLINYSFDYVLGDKNYSFLLIILEIILILLYLFYPKLTNLLYTRGGSQIINKPVKLYELNSITSSQNLNGSNNSTYNFAMSFWVYIDSVPPSVNNTYTKEGNILSLGKTPIVRYKSINNSIIVSVESNNSATGERIIANIPDIKLQKWNQILINYTSGTMDVFYNSKLISSTIEVVSYQNFDLLVIGENNGISGGLANLVYYKEPLDIYKIKYLYNSLKTKSTPSLNFPNKTIIQN